MEKEAFKWTIKTLLETLSETLEALRHFGCANSNKDCTECPFRYDGENGGYSCVIGKMERLLNYITDNMEENNA